MASTQPTLAASSIASWAGGKELTIISQSLSNLFPFFFSTKDVTIGPTAIMAIMTGEVFSGDKEVCDNYLLNPLCSLHISSGCSPTESTTPPFSPFSLASSSSSAETSGTLSSSSSCHDIQHDHCLNDHNHQGQLCRGRLSSKTS